MDRQKRLLDIVLSSLAIASLSPVYLLIAMAIWMEDGDPVIFRQKRVGRNGRIFTVYKFRKLARNAKCGSMIAVGNDLPYTRVGRILEKSKLNEIPQLVNVIRGDMSLVGPRPEIPEFANCFSGPCRRLLDYAPGIFGPSQCAFRSEAAMYPADCDMR
jgi:lipopolysaccharide/colanic/teichoic acid biosynthesis glycosyltransferase